MTQKTEKPDYQKICGELMVRLKFAIDHLKADGTGLSYDRETGKTKPWRHYLAEGIEMCGYTIDKDDLDALDLPAAARRKYFANKAKAKNEAA
ncbi:MAG: hypothetical protein WC100_01335 [Sterolibacterium sp.]